MDESIKTCLFGGYEKISVLKYVDKLTSEMYMLREALARKKKGKEYVIPAHTEENNLKNGAFGGYDKAATDKYILSLEDEIEKLRIKLNDND